MRRFLIFLGIGVAILLILGWATRFFMRKHTKSFSPEEQVIYKKGDLELKVFYNRPFKKDREIFGALVPYNEVWRTGANEATLFFTNKNLTIEGKTLRQGTYSLWTIPREDTWTIIFNSEYGQWGINSQGQANRDPSRDAIRIDITAIRQNHEAEQFTISFKEIDDNDVEMVLWWDTTLIAFPISY